MDFDFYKIVLFIVDGMLILCAYMLFLNILKEIDRRLNSKYRDLMLYKYYIGRKIKE